MHTCFEGTLGLLNLTWANNKYLTYKPARLSHRTWGRFIRLAIEKEKTRDSESTQTIGTEWKNEIIRNFLDPFRESTFYWGISTTWLMTSWCGRMYTNFSWPRSGIALCLRDLRSCGPWLWHSFHTVLIYVHVLPTDFQQRNVEGA